MKMIPISVIVPVYNAAPWLATCIDSILAQSVMAAEIILVDDGSEDTSPMICRQYADNHDHITYIRIPNSGPSVARNTGVMAARSPYIAFVDADDVAHPDMLLTFVRILERHPEAEMVCAPMMEFKTPSPDMSPIPTIPPTRCCRGSLFVESMLYQNSPEEGVSSSVCAKLYRTDLWHREAFTPGIIYEDLEAMWRIALEAREIALTSTPVYYYRHTPGSITTTFLPRRSDALHVATAIANANAASPSLRKAAKIRTFSAAFNLLLLISANRAKNEMATEAEECRRIIKSYRHEALTSPFTRIRDKGGALLSIIPGLKVLEHPNIAKKFIKR